MGGVVTFMGVCDIYGAFWTFMGVCDIYGCCDIYGAYTFRLFMKEDDWL